MQSWEVSFALLCSVFQFFSVSLSFFLDNNDYDYVLMLLYHNFTYLRSHMLISDGVKMKIVVKGKFGL